MDRLPEELLADILRRLPPRPLAVCRSVSKSLRAVVDRRGLLLALTRRVPRGLCGILINYVGQDRHRFFSRPAAAPRFLEPIGWGEVEHSCNGLVLFQDWGTLCVCNPATRRWAKLPECPEGFGYGAHLIFDPTVSLHYEVITFSEVPRKPRIPVQPDIERPPWCQRDSQYSPEEIKNLPYSLRAKHDDEVKIKGAVQWPPFTYVAQVFSSRTGRWEERAYVREDDTTVTLLDVWSDPWGVDSETLSYNAPRCNAACWRGAYYLHCRGDFVMRLSLLEHKYKVIKTPNLDNLFIPPRLDINEYLSQESPYKSKDQCLRDFQMDQEYLGREKPYMYFGKSEHGLYYTALCWYQLQVWVLREVSESRTMPEWELKHKADIGRSFLRYYTTSREDRKEIQISWSLDRGKEGSDNHLVDCVWDSSDESFISVEGEDEVNSGHRPRDMMHRIDLLGYHPSKDIAFLGNHFDGFAYNLGSSKLQYLGTFDPVGSCHYLVAATHESFIYTPCMDDLLLEQKKNTRHDDDNDEEGEDEEDEDDEEDADDDVEEEGIDEGIDVEDE